MSLLKILKEADSKEFKADSFNLGHKLTVEGESRAPITYYYTYTVEIDKETNEKYWKLLKKTIFIWP